MFKVEFAGINIFVREIFGKMKGIIMKREYSYGSVILVEILVAIFAFVLYKIFGSSADESTIYNLLSSVITWLGSFIIASGLINNRKGSVGDYLNQLQRLDKKAIIVNLILIAITIVLTFSFGKIGVFDVESKKLNLLSLSVLGTLLAGILSIFTAYANHIVSDPRNKDQSIMDALKSVFAIGIKLFGKTITLYLLYIVLPIILIFGIIVGIVVGTNSPEAGIGIIMLGGGILGLYYILISPLVSARLSDNYLNLTGDIEREIEKENPENNNEFTITRNI